MLFLTVQHSNVHYAYIHQKGNERELYIRKNSKENQKILYFNSFHNRLIHLK